jgi:hypothetical protein
MRAGPESDMPIILLLLLTALWEDYITMRYAHFTIDIAVANDASKEESLVWIASFIKKNCPKLASKIRKRWCDRPEHINEEAWKARQRMIAKNYMCRRRAKMRGR